MTSENDELVAEWLQRAGVGERSAKWREIMALGLDWQFVRAHALERLADRKRIFPGLFIKRLLDGDPAPAPRCPECYSPLMDYGGDFARCSSQLCDYYEEYEEEGGDAGE